MPPQLKYEGPALALIYLCLQPGERHQTMLRPKTARQLLQALSLLEETALVIRQGELLTPDRHLWPGDAITVRLAGSRG